MPSHDDQINTLPPSSMQEIKKPSVNEVNLPNNFALKQIYKAGLFPLPRPGGMPYLRFNRNIAPRHRS